MKRKLCRMLLLLGTALMMAACSSKEAASTEESQNNVQTQEQGKEEGKEETENRKTSDAVLGGNVGILFPGREKDASSAQARQLEKLLQEKGYETELVYAGFDGGRQEIQAEEMIRAKKNCLIIYPTDSQQLEKQLAQAKKQGITVVSYRDLIENTKDVSYYVGFDYSKIGKETGEYIVKQKKLDKAKQEKKSYTIEFFMGSLTDRNLRVMFDSMKEVLDPYFEQGVLQCDSLRLSYEDASIAKASKEIAGKTCENIMKANYQDDPVDIVCVGDDIMGDSILEALKAQDGFKKQMPLVIGCHADEATEKRMKDGLQALSYQLEEEQLPKLCADLVHQAIQEEKGKTDNTIDNGKAKIPAVFAESKAVDAVK